MAKLPRRFTDIPLKDRVGVVTYTPTRYIEEVALRPAVFDSDELVDIIIDRELADLKVLILARRQKHLEDEEDHANEPGNQ